MAWYKQVSSTWAATVTPGGAGQEANAIWCKGGRCRSISGGTRRVVTLLQSTVSAMWRACWLSYRTPERGVHLACCCVRLPPKPLWCSGVAFAGCPRPSSEPKKTPRGYRRVWDGVRSVNAAELEAA